MFGIFPALQYNLHPVFSFLLPFHFHSVLLIPSKTFYVLLRHEVYYFLHFSAQCHNVNGFYLKTFVLLSGNVIVIIVNISYVFVQRASLTRLTGCGTKKSFLLLSSIGESKIISKLHTRNSESVVSSTLNVKLRSVKILQQYVVLDPNYKTVSGLQYHYQCQVKAYY